MIPPSYLFHSFYLKISLSENFATEPERLTLLRELLSDKGSIYIHADWHKVHHLRLVMDEIFGPNNFRNEIIRWYLWGGRGKKQWNSKHENILFYSKSDNWTFNYMDVLDDHNLMTEGSKNRLNYAGAMVTTKSESSDIPEDKVLPSDTWYVATINAMANEKENYPTQKPENLLAKIILASSNENDLVFDCFMGSGTTQAVASKLGRRYIGSDINLGAIQTSTKRLLKIMDENPNTTGFEVYNVNDYDFFRNELEAKQLIIDALEIQPMNVSNIYDGELDGRMVKIMPINRITTKFDLSELIANFPYDIFSKRKEESPSEPVERITIVCMGHEPDIKASLLKEVGDYKIDVNIVDILKDKKVLQLKRESEGLAIIRDNQVVIESFFPMNLLQKLSLDEQNVEDWRQLVESVLIDFNYDGAVLNPTEIDIPIKDSFVKGVYDIPEDAGTIRIKITDILSESLEIEAVK